MQRPIPSPAGIAAGSAAAGRHLTRPLAIHCAIALLTVLLLVLPSPAGSARAGAGLYFAVVLVPAVQLLLWTFVGWRASLAAGVVVAGLTGLQTVLPPRPLVSQPTQWSVRFSSPEQVLRSRLAPPPNSQSPRLLVAGGTATLHICRYRGTAEDIEVSLGTAVLADVKARPSGGSCWLKLAVQPALMPSPPTPIEVTVRPNRERWPLDVQPTVLTGGFTRPPGQGGRSGGASFFDGAAWTDADLSPSDPGIQAGRYFVELRLADASGRVREVWY